MRHLHLMNFAAGLALATVLAGLLFLLMLMPSRAGAMDLWGIGPRIGSVDPDGMDQALTVGVHFDLQESGSRIHLIPNVMYWDQDGLADINPNMDAMYHFGSAGSVSPYLGAGVGLHFYSSDGPTDPGTDPSANFFGGVLVPARSMSWFFEGRAVVADRDEFGLLTGVTFPLSH
ncbi:MAG: hypothetical protein ACRENN_03085 [Candidatus Eiseniibacteriota bacterium]